MGKGALAGIVSAEAITVLETMIKSMTSAKLMLAADLGSDRRAGGTGEGVMGIPRFIRRTPARKQ